MDQAEAHYQAKKRVTLIGAAVNILLSALKIWLGWIGHSQALIADGLHSLSDLASDVMVLVAAKYSRHHADEEHPYGHARFETVAAVGLGLLLILVGAWVVYDAGQRLLNPGTLWQPGALALGVTIFSILSKEALYHYTLHVARQVRSPLLKANAWHHRTDSISSVIVLIGVVGAMAGVNWLDAVAAIGVALMIAHVGWGIAWQGIDELVDKGLSPDKLAQIREIIGSVAGVRALHLLRTRRMGEDALVDVHILVPPRLSVSEGHQISEAVRWRLIREIEEISDVTVHIDPEDDEVLAPNANLPMRARILADLEQHWAEVEETRHIERIILHYLGGKVSLDVYLPLSLLRGADEAAALSARLAGLAGREPYIGQIRLYFG